MAWFKLYSALITWYLTDYSPLASAELQVLALETSVASSTVRAHDTLVTLAATVRRLKKESAAQVVALRQRDRTISQLTTLLEKESTKNEGLQSQLEAALDSSESSSSQDPSSPVSQEMDVDEVTLADVMAANRADTAGLKAQIESLMSLLNIAVTINTTAAASTDRAVSNLSAQLASVKVVVIATAASNVRVETTLNDKKLEGVKSLFKK